MSLTVSLPRDKINIKCSNDGSADNFDDVKLNLALEEVSVLFLVRYFYK